MVSLILDLDLDLQIFLTTLIITEWNSTEKLSMILMLFDLVRDLEVTWSVSKQQQDGIVSLWISGSPVWRASVHVLRNLSQVKNSQRYMYHSAFYYY